MMVFYSVKKIYKVITALLLISLSSYAIKFCQAERCSVESNLKVRLAGFNSTLAGYVEICKNETWMKVATDTNSWTHKNSIVVCQQLKYWGALWLFDRTSYVQPVRSSSEVNVYPANVECTGTEHTLSDCMGNHQPSLEEGHQFNFVACSKAPANGDVRLVAVTSSDSEGLVEMFYPHRKYRWSTLCSNGWDDIEADIVCKQLGYLTGKSKIYGSLDVNADNTLPRKRYDNFKCSGMEMSLSQCPSDGPYPYKCYSGDYAGVVCQNHDDPVTVDVPPTAAFLVLVTGVLLLLLVVATLVVKCALKKFKKRIPTVMEQALDGSSHCSIHHQRVSRVRLDPHAWQYTTGEGYSPLSNPAPPSYTDTIRADQEAQHQLSQQAISPSMSYNDQNTEQIQINEHLSEISTNIDD